MPGGFSVYEVWQSQAQQESWLNEHVTPNLPATLLDATSTECIQRHTMAPL
jgi:hypothetical protein